MKKLFLVLTFLFTINAWASNYSDAQKEMKKGKYDRAIKKYNMALEQDVVKGMVSSAVVNKELANASTAYTNQIVKEAKQYETEKKLKKSLSTVDKGLKVLPSSNTFLKMQSAYQKKISELEAQVEKGKAYLNNKEWLKAFNYYRTLMPYQDTLSSIKSSYNKSLNNIVSDYKKQAKQSEKNYDFISAKKHYQAALAYKKDDKGIIKKIEEMDNRIEAQKMFNQAKNLLTNAKKEEAFIILLEAQKKDKNNFEISTALKMLTNEIASLWSDKAVAMENKNQIQDAYLLIDEADKIKPSDSSVKKRIKENQQRIVLKLAEFYKNIAEKSNNELAYIYYSGSYALNSKQNDVKQKIQELQKQLTDKSCYLLSFNIVKDKNAKLDAETLNMISENLKMHLNNYASKKCIITENVSFSAAHGNLYGTVKEFDISRRVQKIPRKVAYKGDFKKQDNKDYFDILKQINNDINKTSLQSQAYKKYAELFVKYEDAQNELKLIKEDVKRYQNKEYEVQKQAAKQNNEKFNLDKNKIKTPYDAKYSELDSFIKNNKQQISYLQKAVPEQELKDLKQADEQIKKQVKNLKKLPKYNLLSTEKWYQYNEEFTKLTGKIDFEITVIDTATKQKLATVRKIVNFGEDERQIPRIELITDAGKQLIEKGNQKSKLISDNELRTKLIVQLSKDVLKGIEDSNLKNYGDRYYVMFKNIKTVGASNEKTKNAVLTYIVQDKLSDKKLFTESVNEYIKNNFGVDLKKRKVELTDKTRI